LADFRHRFGRDTHGMWLPEAAVNDDVLRVLAEEGVRFTILAPGQAARVRSLDESPNDESHNDESDNEDGGWHEIDDQHPLDTTVPYRWCDPSGSGRTVDILFYHGGLSHDLAFGLGSMSSQDLIERVIRSAPEGGLVTIATDGETFGHHHTYGDRLLAYALAVEADRRGVEVTNANQFLSYEHPEHEVAIKESAWS